MEQFIKVNKHLPEVQSAQQMKESGLLVGDFQIKLLQKIEELTLYLIDQNSKLSSQQELLEKQQQEIKELKSKIK